MTGSFDGSARSLATSALNRLKSRNEETAVKTDLTRKLAIALVGSMALGVGSGCSSFWAASAPEPAPKQEMEEAEPIEDTEAEDDAEETGEADSDMAAPESGSKMGSADSGMAGDKAKPEMEVMKMTVSAMSPNTATADMYWDVADNTAMGTTELKLQLVSADSGAELKACREIKVSADSKSFMGERVGVEVEKRAERLTTYLPQDALDQLAAANTVTVFACEYKFLLDRSQQSKLGELRDSSTEADTGIDNTGAESGSTSGDTMEGGQEGGMQEDSGDMGSGSDY